jgi:ABC-type multidrug transport system ATPase subunit
MYALEVDCVTRHFGQRRVLTNASLRAVSGRILHLMGRNGAGKTTLLKIAAGCLRAEIGHVNVRGRRIRRPTLARMARAGIFFMPEETLLAPSMFLARQLDAVGERYGTASQMGAVSEQLALDGLLDRLPSQMSAREQRRATIGLAMLRHPAVLLADEPLRGIDPVDSERILQAMRELAQQGSAVVVTGHETGWLEAYCDDVSAM